MIVPFAPGGATDVVARLVAERLSVALGQPVALDNRAGANGIIGTDAVAKSAPDGYTLLMTTGGAQTVSPSLYPLPYDSIKDLAPISMVATLGTMIVVHPSVPAKTLQEFIALAKANPGKYNYATGSSLINLVGETFKLATGTDIVAIPYKGTAPQLSAVLAGEAAMTIDPFTAVQHVKSGKLRALAVLSPKRSSLLPEVPTLQEAGVSGVELDAWAGMLAPAGTPAPVIRRLHAEITKIVATPDFRERLAALNYEPAGTTPEQFMQLIVADTAKWAKAVKATNFKVQ
ncbi:tripartite tricarboxylate transporter substrate binding protein [Aquabacterium sp. J223]|nr:tripartite tricarboxylate transporter substrate binding protein [Aquabacterium sp. J223]UUX97350.1 tripartite tricarboxylate transporter substrate binding protein [Aquabacterium sp. J223]